jgi:CubicO group peptidase (beta-lactamase class C family)
MKILSFLLLLVVSLFSFSTYPQQILDDEKSREIDEYIHQEMEERKIPGLALAVIHKGEIIKERGYGLADIQNQVPVKTNTVFELASITKQFTASAIMILHQEGKLNIDDPINQYLEEAPENWKEVSIRHLLTHTSGLPAIGQGFTGFKEMAREDLLKLRRVNLTKDLAYKAAKTDTLRNTPGEKYAYSDVGYFLLGLIVQEASGMHYREFLQKKIFDPAGMDTAYILDQVKIHANEARGYTLRDGELVNLRRIWEFEVPSHYGVFSTIGDLAKWDKALYSNKILSQESKELMWQPMKRNNGMPSPYGFGWTIWQRGDKKIIDHTGITGTQITRFLDDKLTIVVLTNLGKWGQSKVRSWGIGPKIGQMLGSSPYIDKNYTALNGSGILKKQPARKLKDLEGNYEMEKSGDQRKIIFKNGRLFYVNGPSKNEMVVLENGQFLLLGITEEWLMEEKGSNEFQWYLKGQKTGKMRKTEK